MMCPFVPQLYIYVRLKLLKDQEITAGPSNLKPPVRVFGIES